MIISRPTAIPPQLCRLASRAPPTPNGCGESTLQRGAQWDLRGLRSMPPASRLRTTQLSFGMAQAVGGATGRTCTFDECGRRRYSQFAPAIEDDTSPTLTAQRTV